jgi:hypothetical protein
MGAPGMRVGGRNENGVGLGLRREADDPGTCQVGDSPGKTEREQASPGAMIATMVARTSLIWGRSNFTGMMLISAPFYSKKVAGYRPKKCGKLTR